MASVPMRMLVAAFCVVLPCASLAGCAKDRERAVRAPRGGAPLRFDLATGTSFDGHLRVGTTREIEGLRDSLTQSVECDARLLVMATDEDGAVDVRASFRNVVLDWSVLPEVGLSSDEFAKLAATELRSIELRFKLSARGRLLTMPKGPDRPRPEIRGLLDTLGLAVTSGFVELPASSVQPGTRWTVEPDEDARPRGVPRIEATLEGFRRRGKTGPTLARVEQSFTSSREVVTDTGPRRRQLQGSSVLLLEESGVPAEIETELHDFDPRRGLAVQQIKTSWSRSERGNTTTTDVQQIDDPCDDDYVGSELCSPPPQP